MAVDTPARIAIFGAGPIGLEAGLYARFLGYDVDIYERGRVCENLRQWGHVRLFTPLGINRSSLGLAALAAQNPEQKLPGDDHQFVTAEELVQIYFQPLAESDLLADSVHTETTVVRVGRDGLCKGELVGKKKRRKSKFRILVRRAVGGEEIRSADIVLDCSGTYGQPNRLGHGGMPAIGELELAERFEYGLPDVLGAARERYAGKRVLLVGNDYSAALNIVALAKLAQEAPGTRVQWITRLESEAGPESPIPAIASDSLSERRALASAANQLAQESSAITYWGNTTIQAIRQNTGSDAFQVELLGKHAGLVDVDEIIASVGHRPDGRLHEELHVHQCYASEAPMKLGIARQAVRLEKRSAQELSGPETLLTSEPNFYILGAKSYGRDSQFLLSTGREQIRDLFTIIGDREDLDLYASMQKMNSKRR